MDELKDQALEEVSGGYYIVENKRAIQLTGSYWATCYQEGPAYDAAKGWSGLFIEKISIGTAPYRISDKDGIIGYTIPGHFYYI